MAGQPPRTDSFLTHLAAAGWMPWFYLGQAVLPSNLSVIHPKWEIDSSLWLSYLPGMALVGCLTLFWWNRRTWGRSLLFALGYFVVMLFPVLGFFNQGFYQYSLVADHWQYFSIIGAIALVVAVGSALYRRMGEPSRRVGLAASVVVLEMLGVGTWGRAYVYASSQRLWEDTLAKNPGCWVCHNLLGNDLLHAGRIQDATGHFERALRIKPDYVEAQSNLGLALVSAGKLKAAILHYKEALRINPKYAEAHNNWGIALCQSGNLEEGVWHFEQAARLRPNIAEAQNNWANALLQGGKLAEAIHHYEQALRINPDYAEAHNNLGYALLKIGKVEDAIHQYEEALRLKPDSVDVKENLAKARTASVSQTNRGQ